LGDLVRTSRLLRLADPSADDGKRPNAATRREVRNRSSRIPNRKSQIANLKSKGDLSGALVRTSRFLRLAGPPADDDKHPNAATSQEVRNRSSRIPNRKSQIANLKSKGDPSGALVHTSRFLRLAGPPVADAKRPNAATSREVRNRSSRIPNRKSQIANL